jgi:ABC-2 type transport system permease protein
MRAHFRLWRHWCAVTLRQMAAMTSKEFRQLTRDRALLLFIAYIFTVNIIMAGQQGSLELNQAPLLVYDADRSAASRDLISRFQMPYFRFAGEAASPSHGLRTLEEGTALVFLDIPERFGQKVAQGREPAVVQLNVDATKTTRSYLAAAYSGSIVGKFSLDWTPKRAANSGETSLPRIDNRVRLRFNPALNESWFSSISELLTMMTVACILLPASAMVREKERGTIEQLLVSPLSPFQIMFSKVLAMTTVMLIGIGIAVVGIMQPMFHVPVRGSMGLLCGLTALFVFTNAGLGLLVATYARNAGQAGMLTLLLVMPIVVLSGTYTPVESMPAVLRTTMQLSPLRHFIEIIYGILLRGAGIDTLWDSVLAMIVLGSGLFGLGMWRFRRQFQ